MCIGRSTIMHKSLQRWNSCPQLLSLPPHDFHVRRIHVYDFDNTLYLSPQPNRQFYTRSLLGTLYGGDLLNGRDWWSEPLFLEKSFNRMLAIEDESAREQEFWNKEIVDLAKSSFEDKETVSILLTGRKEEFFGPLFEKTLKQCNATFFNAICLKKPGVGSSTMEYKTAVLKDLIDEYEGTLEEITIYDDRLSQVQKFKTFFDQIGGTFQRMAVPVVPRYRLLDNEEECRMILELAGPGVVSWTPRQNGFFLNTQSHKSLLSFTFSFFQKKYNWNVLPEYPMYIPCCQLDQTPPVDQIARIWTNDQPNVDIQECLQKFQSQDTSCEIDFNVVELGHCGRSPRRINVFFRAEPCDKSRYLWSQFEKFIVVGRRYDSSDDDSLLQRVVEGKQPSMRWIKLRRPLKIKTYFGHYARLDKDEKL
ncbi:hypothetical protein ZYGR_0AZ01120 [Zygosaccharomyces rouxii]|uniref:Uncharacterized protein n=1 Tax=Zygosaccharomyces rouxii TaxID=4956 RepID=A0A1Q3AJX4_ZYGRO|nr:hypothetical protein ZYGR_0AZ01120 [Zygosaccharomyces rouxii]